MACLQARPVRKQGPPASAAAARAPLYTRRRCTPRPATDVRFLPPPHATRRHHSLLSKPRQQGQRPPQPLKHPSRRGPGRLGEAAVAARSDPGTGRSRWACGSPSAAAGPRASDPQASQLHRSETARHSKTAAGHRARVGVLSRSPCRGNAQGEDPLQAWPTPASATPPRPPAPAMQRERRAAAAPSGSPSSSALAAATPSESA